MARVIVVGGGLAGLSAAHTLLERGANVTLLDKQPYVAPPRLFKKTPFHNSRPPGSWVVTQLRPRLESTAPEHKVNRISASRTVPGSSLKIRRNP